MTHTRKNSDDYPDYRDWEAQVHTAVTAGDPDWPGEDFVEELVQLVAQRTHDMDAPGEDVDVDQPFWDVVAEIADTLEGREWLVNELVQLVTLHDDTLDACDRCRWPGAAGSPAERPGAGE